MQTERGSARARLVLRIRSAAQDDEAERASMSRPGKGIAAAIAGLVLAAGVGLRAVGDDIAHMLGREHVPPVHIPEPPKLPREPLPLPREPIPVPRVPIAAAEVVSGKIPERPDWWDSFVEELQDRAPDAIDYMKDVVDAMAATKCPRRKSTSCRHPPTNCGPPPPVAPLSMGFHRPRSSRSHPPLQTTGPITTSPARARIHGLGRRDRATRLSPDDTYSSCGLAGGKSHAA